MPLFSLFRVRDRQVWCTLVGEVRDRPPLIVVPGGPGTAHLYLRALEAVGNTRPVIFYDSLASGRSERVIRDHWTIADQLEEVEALARFVAAPRYHLLGHSAANFSVYPFAFSHPPGLASLVLASCTASIPRYHEGIDARLAYLSPADKAEFLAAEHDPRLRDKKYLSIAVKYVQQMFHTPPSMEFVRSLEGATNVLAHRAIKGGSMYYTTSMATWDVMDRLGEIETPTLITCGRHDFVTPEVCEEMQKRIQRAELTVFENSAHMAHAEETAAYVARLETFFAAND